MGFNLGPDHIVVGFTGTQVGMTNPQKEKVREVLLDVLMDSVFAHHGDCIGADAEFHEICDVLGIPIILHPPTDPKKRAWCEGSTRVLLPRPYLERNRDIVKASTDMIATPKEFTEQLRSGTWSTVRYSRKCKRRLHLILPDGTIQENG